MNKLKVLLVAAATAAWTSAAVAERQYNLTTPVTQGAAQLDTLHWVLLILCTVIGLGVFLVMFYSIIAHRKSRGVTPATFTESHTVEVIWTVIPFLIVVAIGIYATPIVMAQKDTSNADLTIKVTGYQWKWGYDYLKGEGEGIGFLSTLTTPASQIDDRAFPDAIQSRSANPNYLREVDNEMVVPVDRKIRLVLTANDVIHAWMIPAFGVKQDAIPGFVRETWFKAEKPGVYRGQCAELCGKDHAFMPIVVRVLPAEEYTKWVEGKKKEMAAQADDPARVWTLEELKARGEKVYAANCVACHQATGKGVPGAFPALDGSKVVLGAHADQVSMLLKGKNAMPKWDQLSDTELAAVMTYTRNAWGNATGQVIQPMVFLNARSGKMPEGGGAQAAAEAAPAPAPSAAAAAPAAAATPVSLPAKFYFEVGKAALPANSPEQVDVVKAFLAAHPDAQFEISGFVDATGSAAANAELAKQRALAVRDALKAAGVPEDRITLRKPESITGSADAREARRVEVRQKG